MDDRRIDELYAAPLADFVAHRNALAKELRSEGASDEATLVASLRKPTMVAWALNQAARSERDTVERLLDVQSEMRESPSAAGLRALSDERQRLVSRVSDAAVEALEAAGHAGAAARDRISLSVLATGTDREAAETLRAGRLATEMAASSAWDFMPAASSPADPVAEADDTRRVELERARRRLDELNERAATLEDRADRLEQEVEEAQRRAAVAREAAATARDDADRQAEEVAGLDGG